MPIDITAALTEQLVSDAASTKVSNAVLEVLVGQQEAISLSNSVIELLVAPDLDTTQVMGTTLEVLVSPTDRIVVSGVLMELLVAPGLPTSSLSLPIELHIIEKQEPRPLTDKWSEEYALPGWEWDRRRLEDSYDYHAQYNTYLGGHTVGLLDGTKKSYWQSGSNGTCTFQYNSHPYLRDRRLWTPVVNSGVYYLQSEQHLLYSDYSTSDRFSTDILKDNVMSVTLHEDAMWNTIQVALWYRDDALNIRKYWNFQPVTTFTGELSGNTRLSTQSGSTILSANLSDRHREFLIQNGKVLLNGSHYISNVFLTSSGFPEVPENNLEDLLEPLGAVQEEGSVFYSRYLPIQTGSTRLLINSGGTIVEYSATDNLVWSSPTDTHYEIDYDLGIIKTGGIQLPELMLFANIGALDASLTVYTEVDKLDTYPQQGVLVIGSEQIAYYERTGNQFLQLTRGFNGTTPSAHTRGTTLAHRQQGLGITGVAYLEYIAVPRIDYEVVSHTKRSANTYEWLDIQPLANTETTNILQIYPGDISLDRIVLTTDTPLIGGIQYGPLYFGSDVSELTATAYDINNYPVPDISLSINIIQGYGYLNGQLNSYTDITNTLGQIYSYYNYPLSIADLEQAVESVTHDAGDTILEVPSLSGRETVENIWIYQILKFDKSIGTTGIPLEVLAEGSASLPYGLYYLELDGLLNLEDFRDGVLYITIAGINYTRSITYVEHFVDIDAATYTRIYLDSTLSAATGNTAYCLESQAITFNPALLNGVRHILYEYTSDAIHPLTGSVGAYLPIHPTSINGTTLTFENRLLPIPNPTDKSVNVAGYVVVTTSYVQLQSYGTNPVNGQIVSSNIIELSLNFPNYMTGVDGTGVLPVPYGWTLPTEELNVGAGLSGANFITINSQAFGVGQMALSINIP